MNRFLLVMLGLVFGAPARSAAPVLDNEHVTVWDSTAALAPAMHDFVEVSLSRKGTASFGHRGERPGRRGSRTIVIELKDLPVGPLANESGYPLAFPRKHGKRLLENAQVVVWDYTWRAREPTPMHFHDKDAVAVFEAAGSVKSTTPDGKSVISESRFGDVKFGARNRIHSEILVGGKAHAVVVELK